MSVGTLFFSFLSIAFLICSILIFLDNDKIIPSSFKRFRDHSFYHVWRNFYAAGLLLMVSSFILLAICFAQKEFNGTTGLYLGLGIAIFLISVAIIFYFNKKALHTFDPAFYSRNNLVKEDKEKRKIKDKNKYNEENNKRYEEYRKDNK